VTGRGTAGCRQARSGCSTAGVLSAHPSHICYPSRASSSRACPPAALGAVDRPDLATDGEGDRLSNIDSVKKREAWRVQGQEDGRIEGNWGDKSDWEGDSRMAG
jgi:hypothetical protein